MAYCEKCGNKLAKGASFCSTCGAPARPGQREERYDGEICKCPNCGAMLEAFCTYCPSCGYELRGVGGASRVNELAAKLESAASPEQKDEFIRNFYIPNTREDIYEFFILAASNIEAGGENTDAWYAKLDQAYKKASLVLGDGSELERLKKLFEDANKSRTSKSILSILINSSGAHAAILFCIGCVLVIFGEFGGSSSGDPNSPFYMVCIVGQLCLIGAFFIFLLSKEKKTQGKRWRR